MATFTAVSKHRLSWQAPETNTTGTPEVDFVFSNGVDFLFSDGSDLLFSEEKPVRVTTPWAGSPKEKMSWPAPATVSTGTPQIDFAFSDSSDFFFSNGIDFIFREETSERLPTTWTRLTKSR